MVDRKTTLGQWLNQATAALEAAEVFLGHGTDSYWDEALHLTLPSLQIGFDADRSILERVLAEEEHQQLQTLLSKRIQQRIPAPYLTGQAWFAQLPFSVNESVLIPRSPIAELIESGFEPWFVHEGQVVQPRTILDLCCGSGCIGIACAEYLPESTVDMADLSPQALAVAAENIRRYDLQDRVSCYQGDLFSALPEGKRYDVIVCNPPYVDAGDMATLPAEFLHEPRLALAAGEDGLDLVKQILAAAVNYLNEGGLLIVEVGNSREALEEQFPQVPFWWLEFSRGGEGVLLLTREQLQEYWPVPDVFEL